MAPLRLGDIVIPVLDLREGIVVLANGGERRTYPPVSVCTSSEPHDVLAWLLLRYPFRRCYVADLDALEGVGRQTQLLLELCRRFADVTFFIDAAWRNAAELPPTTPENFAIIVGTESIQSPDEGARLLTSWPPARVVLSVDRRGPALVGCLPAPATKHEPLHATLALDLERIGRATQRSPRDEATAWSTRERWCGGGLHDERALRAAFASGFRGLVCGTGLYSGEIDRHVLCAAADKP